MDNHVLDACALLTFLNDEEGVEIMAEIFQKAEDGQIAVYMSIINLLEVYYDRLRTSKNDRIDEFLEFIRVAPITVINSISDFVYHEAARLKAFNAISLADAIGVATAKEISAQFVTSDHSELEIVEQQEPVSFLWLPPKPKK
ncbi:MAG: type II toxin-antitoxin system VapC family toxin [Treponema sp.]|jgi:predicted nucleic acid-binding protein|nr:type II toxin-antitoxin system VapC family toxin [Treponema sp.]